MNLLIDTHALIWFITDSDKLPRRTKERIENKDNVCFVSISSYWEMGIKHAIGRLELTSDLENIFRIIDLSGFIVLPITVRHILLNARLAFYH